MIGKAGDLLGHLCSPPPPTQRSIDSIYVWRGWPCCQPAILRLASVFLARLQHDSEGRQGRQPSSMSFVTLRSDGDKIYCIQFSKFRRTFSSTRDMNTMSLSDFEYIAFQNVTLPALSAAGNLICVFTAKCLVSLSADKGTVIFLTLNYACGDHRKMLVCVGRNVIYFTRICRVNTLYFTLLSFRTLSFCKYMSSELRP